MLILEPVVVESEGWHGQPRCQSHLGSEVLNILQPPTIGYLIRMNLTHHRANVQKDIDCP